MGCADLLPGRSDLVPLWHTFPLVKPASDSHSGPEVDVERSCRMQGHIFDTRQRSVQVGQRLEIEALLLTDYLYADAVLLVLLQWRLRIPQDCRVIGFGYAVLVGR